MSAAKVSQHVDTTEPEEDHMIDTQPVEAPPGWFEDLVDARITVLQQVIAIARNQVLTTLDSQGFALFVRFVTNERIVSADELKDFGKVDRSTAGRWVNVPTAPSPLSQEGVIEKIIDKATREIAELKQGNFESIAPPDWWGGFGRLGQKKR